MQLEHEHLRQQVVTGSELAALFDKHPYLTRFLLWHRKRGTAPKESEVSSNPALRGQYFEDGVARWAADILKAKIHPTSVFLERTDMAGLGGTPDRYITVGGEMALLECKTMNFWAARKYPDRDVPPEHYVIQTKLYALLKGVRVGYLAIYYLGDDDLRIYPIEPTEEDKAAFVKAAADFWESIRNGDEPEVSGEDIDTLKAMGAGKTSEDILDLSDDNFLVDRAGQYIQNAQQIKALEAFQDSLKADILHKTIAKPCKKARLGDYEVVFTHRAGSPDKVITQDMVGEIIKGRAGSVSLSIKKGK